MRLIDADALMPNAEYKGRYDVVTAYDIADAPTIEPERKAIEDEVWEFATTCTKMDGADSVDVFGGYSLDSFTKYSYQEAKAKYDAWKKLKEDEATMKEVIALAEKIGIHKLYSMVKEIRGE